MLNSIMNLSMLAGPLLATFIIQFGGYRTIMFIAAAMALSSFLVFDTSDTTSLGLVVRGVKNFVGNIQ